MNAWPSMFQNASPLAAAAAFLSIFFLAQTVGGAGVYPGDYQHVYTDSFPRSDEYNFMALDPRLPHGAPYGGFSRATASRLASLPLKLPSTTQELKTKNNSREDEDDGDAFDPRYTTVRDHFGRAFACRVFHEDELDPESLGDSMFDTPILKKDTDGSQKETPVNDEASTSNTAVGVETQNEALPEKLLNPSEDGYDPIIVGHTIHQRFSLLEGFCAQLHPSTWWSYEWCHQQRVKQFHVSVRKHPDGKIKSYELENVSNLGSFSEEFIHVPGPQTEGYEETEEYLRKKMEEDSKKLSGERNEIGTVVHTFVGGDTCQENGKPRVTEAIFRCCSKRYMAKTKGGVLKNGNPFDTDLVSLLHATEDSNAMCHYNMTLCTPLLCDDFEDNEGMISQTDSSTSSRSVLSVNNGSGAGNSAEKTGFLQDFDPAHVEKMSVGEILDTIFPKSEPICLQQLTGQWWSYEFCAGEYVRQFHEDVPEFIGMKVYQKKKGDTGPKGDGFLLGKYIPDDHLDVTKENEWERVVNATASSQSSSMMKRETEGAPSTTKTPPTKIPFLKAGGNGAYYYQEYTQGDICDDAEITDSAVKAGSFGEGGIERAITVRYACNSERSIAVKEDSTCHYVVDITIPVLCDHPFFKAPVSKKQVYKCLPIEP